MSAKQLQVASVASPTTEKGKVVPFWQKRMATKPQLAPPRRKPNAAVRTREHLTPDEVRKLVQAAQEGRYGQRDATAITLAYRHGLRVSELIALRWEQVDLKAGHLHVSR